MGLGERFSLSRPGGQTTFFINKKITMINRTGSITRQIGALSSRLEKLYANLDEPTGLSSSVVDSVWKEVGIAAEALQVAQEELSQQSDRIALMLEEASVQRRYYANLINQIPEAYLITTKDGKIQEANLMAARLFNLPQSQLVGKLLLTFVPPGQRTWFRTELLQIVQENRPCTWSCWLQPNDRVPVHLTITTSVSLNSDSLNPDSSNPNQDNSDKAQISLHWIVREANAQMNSAFPQQDSFLEQDDRQSIDPHDLLLKDNRPVLSYARGEAISLNLQNLWLVREGLVKIHTLTEENEEVLLGLLVPLMLFGTGSSFLPVYQATALTDVQLLQFSMAEVQASPQLAQLLLPKLNKRFQQMEALMSIAGQRRVRQRLYLLLRLLKQEMGEPLVNGVRLKIRLTHEEIASACCTSRVTVTRLLGELQRQKKIAIDSRFHIILPSDF